MQRRVLGIITVTFMISDWLIEFKLMPHIHLWPKWPSPRWRRRVQSCKMKTKHMKYTNSKNLKDHFVALTLIQEVLTSTSVNACWMHTNVDYSWKQSFIWCSLKVNQIWNNLSGNTISRNTISVHGSHVWKLFHSL